VPSDVVISLDNIQKSYGVGSAQTPVLRGVSFEVLRGEFLAIIGQSGSGQSTLLNIIGGLDHASAGDVTVFGHAYSRSHERQLAGLRNTRIGFVFQHFNLLDHLDCLGNVALPAVFGGRTDDVEARAAECLARVGLLDLGKRRPSELSGGQKQRVAIARALFNEPELLLCDEPTGNLDTKTGRSVIEFFRELNDTDGVTLIIVTHERRVSSVAKRIIRMEDGRMIEGADVTAWIDEAADEAAGDSEASRAAGGEG
jgi:ABC-type lipoprotein export system ATPase subunit